MTMVRLSATRTTDRTGGVAAFVSRHDVVLGGKGLRAAFHDFGSEHVQKTIASGGRYRGRPFAEYSPRYGKWKRAKYPRARKLELTGTLRDSLIHRRHRGHYERHGRDWAEWGTKIEYGRHLQDRKDKDWSLLVFGKRHNAEFARFIFSAVVGKAVRQRGALGGILGRVRRRFTPSVLGPGV